MTAMISPAAVRADIATLCGHMSVPFVPYEPFAAPTRPFVTMFFDGYDANFWNITIRVYSPYETVGAETAQETLDTVMPEVEDALSSQYGPVQWSVLPDFDIKALVASWPVQVGREDV